MVYIIVLNWNGSKDTIACLDSIARLNFSTLSVVVCDNASTDDSWSKLHAYTMTHPDLNIELIETGDNLGYAGGNNVGIRRALEDPTMRYIWLLNNDTVVAPDALNALMSYMSKHADVGICGSTLLYFDEPDVIQAVGGKYNPWSGTSCHVLGHKNFNLEDCHAVVAEKLNYVVGASMFIRRGVLERVGLLSEDYFLYCEEIDWISRMHREAPEYKIGYAPYSIVYHKEGSSTGANDRIKKTYRYFSDYFFITSRLKFSRKYFPLHSLVVQALMLVVVVNRIKRGQWRSAAVALFCFIGVIPAFMDPRKSVLVKGAGL